MILPCLRLRRFCVVLAAVIFFHDAAGVRLADKSQDCLALAELTQNDGSPPFVSWINFRRGLMSSLGKRLLVIRGNLLMMYKPAEGEDSLCKTLIRGPQVLGVLNSKTQLHQPGEGQGKPWWDFGHAGNELQISLPATDFVSGRVADADRETQCDAQPETADCEPALLKIQAITGNCAVPPCVNFEELAEVIGTAINSDEEEMPASYPVAYLRQLPPSTTSALSKAPYSTPSLFDQITATGAGASFLNGMPQEGNKRQLFHDLDKGLDKGRTYLWLLTLGGSFRWAPEKQPLPAVGRDFICHGDLNSFGSTGSETESHTLRGTARAGGEINFRTVFDSNGQDIGKAWVIDDRTSFQGNRATHQHSTPFGLVADKLEQKFKLIKKPVIDEDFLLNAATYMKMVLDVDFKGVYIRSDMTKKEYLKKKFPKAWKEHLKEQDSADLLAQAPYMLLEDADGTFAPVAV